MSTKLLDITRKLGNVIRNSSSDRACIGELARTVSSLIMSNVYLLSNDGIVLESAENDYSIEELKPFGHIDDKVNGRLSMIFSTKENIALTDMGFETSNGFSIVLPVENKRKRYATLILYRENDPFDIEDITVSENLSELISILLSNEANQLKDETKRNVAAAKSAIGSLSYKEIIAAKALLRELPKEGGIIKTSMISEKYNITRSIIINCVKKLESAGIIEARSQGAKGTNIKIKNFSIYDEVSKETADI